MSINLVILHPNILCVPASVVDNLFYDPANVTVALGEVEGTELGRGLVVVGVCRELYNYMLE